MIKKRLNEIFENDGIFAAMEEAYPAKVMPWIRLEIPSAAADAEYIYNVSGYKIASKLVERMLDEDGELTHENLIKFAKIIYATNAYRWDKLCDTLFFEYDPIKNYDMTEQMIDNETVTEYGRTDTRTDNLTHAKTGTEATGYNNTTTETNNLTETKTGTEAIGYNSTETETRNLSHAKTGTDTITNNLTDTDTINTTSTTEDKIYGFNSTTGENDKASTVTNGGTTTTAKTGTVQTGYNTTETDGGTDATAKTGTDTTTYNTTEGKTGTVTDAKTGTDTTTYNTSDTETGTQTNAATGTDTTTNNYELTRSGNIGVTTTQQMIESERNLYIWDILRDTIYKDVDKLSALMIY